MGWNVVIKAIKGRKYAYYQLSIREGKKVPTITKYIGPVVGDDVEAFKATKLSELQAIQEAEGETLREQWRRKQQETQQIIDNATDWAYKTMGEPKNPEQKAEQNTAPLPDFRNPKYTGLQRIGKTAPPPANLPVMKDEKVISEQSRGTATPEKSTEQEGAKETSDPQSETTPATANQTDEISNND